MASLKMLSVVMVVAFFGISTTLTDAQNVPSCGMKLIPCADFLNGTIAPTANCCNPIKDAVANDLSCLCTLYSTPGFLSALKVNITQALQLTKKCGVNADLSACNKTPAPTGTPPPAVPGNDGRRMGWTGFTGLVLLLASFFSLHY